jgi:hypothetical protein
VRHKQNVRERVITYASTHLTPAQQKYWVTRHELRAIVSYTRQFYHYLLGRKFLLCSDIKGAAVERVKSLKFLGVLGLKMIHTYAPSHEEGTTVPLPLRREKSFVMSPKPSRSSTAAPMRASLLVASMLGMATAPPLSAWH